MCQECGCQEFEVNESVTAKNDGIGSQLRSTLESQGIYVVNVMGAPGSGKTSVIEHLADALGAVFVVQGDCESDVDTKRLEARGIRAVQINTHSGCHLNAHMVKHALEGADLSGVRYVFIENVGNLVCPAGVNVGEHLNMVVSSTPEGDDKPTKYPHIFRSAKLVVISKSDIAEAVGFDRDSYTEQLERVTNAKVLHTSTKEPESFARLAHMIAHARDHVLGLPHEH
ncbi:MAG: hydrogenase nickel incorporation protein HypB [Candidatus Woesearchaeota archaeon]